MPQKTEAILHFNNPRCLLTWNRLDIATKVTYLNLKTKSSKYATRLYKNHLNAFSLGLFTEPDHIKKGSFTKYVAEFEEIARSIRENGFDARISLIPLADDG